MKQSWTVDDYTTTSFVGQRMIKQLQVLLDSRRLNNYKFCWTADDYTTTSFVGQRMITQLQVLWDSG
jgi:ATP-dependent Clp protease adapter protein ClpS